MVKKNKTVTDKPIHSNNFTEKKLPKNTELAKNIEDMKQKIKFKLQIIHLSSLFSSKGRFRFFSKSFKTITFTIKQSHFFLK